MNLFQITFKIQIFKYKTINTNNKILICINNIKYRLVRRKFFKWTNKSFNNNFKNINNPNLYRNLSKKQKVF